MDLEVLRLKWLAAIRLDHTRNTVATCRAHAARFMATNPASPLTQAVILDYRQKRLEKVSPITVASEIRTLSAWFGWAARAGLMDSNPCTRLPKSPEATLPPPVWLDDDEVKAVIHSARGTRHHGMVVVAIYSGLRRDELRQLRGEDIDWDRRILWVRHDPKNGSRTKNRRTRSVPLHAMIANLIGSPDPGRLWPRATVGSMARAAATIRKRSGVSKFNWKVCRHTFASRLANAGVSILKISKWLGHASIQTTMVYAHLNEGRYDTDMELID